MSMTTQDSVGRLEEALLTAVTNAVGAGISPGIGTDIVAVDRIRQARSKSGGRLDTLAFTRSEIAYCTAKRYPEIHFAGHLAAKEAVYKALRLNWDMAFSWRFMEIRHRPDGSPYVTFNPDDRELARFPESDRVSISIAHTADHAIAAACVLTG